MQNVPYPLDAARTLRDSDREAALAELGARRAAREQAQATLAGAQAALRSLDHARKPRCAAGVTSGLELARHGAYVRGLGTARARAAQVLKTATLQLSAAEAAERAAEDALRAAHVEQAVLGKHHERWQAEQHRAALQAEHEDLDEQLAARRRALR